MGLVVMLLLGVDLLDELSSGVPVVGAPGIQTAFSLRYTAVGGLLLVVPGLLALLIEPPLFMLADRRPRRGLIVGGLVAMAICDIVAGGAGSVWVLLVALAISAPASGIGVGLAQATIMDAHPDRREAMMTRWTFMGVLGDGAAPLLFYLLARVAAGWREAFVISGLILLVHALALSRQPWPVQVAAVRPGPKPRMRDALRAALGNRRLMLWLVATALCGLLDETLIAFGSLHLHDSLGADLSTRSLILLLFTAGLGLGLVLTERWLQRAPPLRILAVSGGPVACCTWPGSPLRQPRRAVC